MGQKTKKIEISRLEMAIVLIAVAIVASCFGYALCGMDFSAPEKQAQEQPVKTMDKLVAAIEKNVTDAGWQFRGVDFINPTHRKDFASFGGYNDFRKYTMSEVRAEIIRFIEFCKGKNISVVLFERSEHYLSIYAVENVGGTDIYYHFFINVDSITTG